MSAIRLARAYTRRSKILKFIGCYHGHADAFLIQAGSGAMTLGVPDSPGVTSGAAADTLTVPYNDIEAVRQLMHSQGDSIAAIIVEPIAGNMGVILPAQGFLQELRKLTSETGSLLIFDEVITGFRVGLGGAQSLYGVKPDLTCLGKIIGGGLPVGAYGGRADIMSMVSPSGPVYQAGTLAGNPLAVAAGIATLEILQRPGVYAQLEQMGAALASGFARAADEAGIPVYQTRVGGMMCNFFTEGPVTDFASALRSNTERYARYFSGMLARGHYFAPSQFEAAFVSLAHSENDIAETVAAASEVLRELTE
jgi:glutamate-1-semialdehyde 2,1-aminomutase